MATISTTTPTVIGGFTIPWAQLRELLPDERWAVYGAGWVSAPGPAVSASIGYQKDDGTIVTVGSATLPANGKAELGPFPVRGPLATPLGVPLGENIIAIVLQGALVSTGTAASLRRWTLYLRMTPRRT